MSAIIGEQFMFGVPKPDCLPSLPSGFSYVFDPKSFLMATDGQRFFYVKENELVRAQPRMKIIHDGFYCDKSETIPLPP